MVPALLATKVGQKQATSSGYDRASLRRFAHSNVEVCYEYA